MPTSDTEIIAIQFSGTPEAIQFMVDGFIKFAHEFSQTCAEQLAGKDWHWDLESSKLPSAEARHE